MAWPQGLRQPSQTRCRQYREERPPRPDHLHPEESKGGLELTHLVTNNTIKELKGITDTNLSLDPVELCLLVILPGHPPGPLPGAVELKGEGFAEGNDDKPLHNVVNGTF